MKGATWNGGVRRGMDHWYHAVELRDQDIEPAALKTAGHEVVMVQPESVLIHLGDLFFGNDVSWMSQLRVATPGKLWLIKGCGFFCLMFLLRTLGSMT